MQFLAFYGLFNNMQIVQSCHWAAWQTKKSNYFISRQYFEIFLKYTLIFGAYDLNWSKIKQQNCDRDSTTCHLDDTLFILQ